MTETLNITTMIGVPVSTTVGGSLLTDTATNYKTDDNGNVTESKLAPKGVIASSLVTTGTTGSYIYQEVSEKKTLEEIAAEVDTTQAYVQSLSDEELEAALIKLGQLESDTSSNINIKTL